jgi:ABC-type multidrug transport system ATPase subunit
MDLIKIEGLQKACGTFQLGPFDLRVEPGAILGILGREKSGRTTLLRLLWVSRSLPVARSNFSV